MSLYEELKPLLINPQRPEGDGTIRSLCPCHDSKCKISLSLHPKYGLKCWSNCEPKDVIARLKELNGSPPENKSKPSKVIIFPEKPCAIFQYCDVYGNVMAEKGRFEADGNKTFRWRLPGSEAWDGLERGGLKLSDLPLFGAEMVAERDHDQPVFVCEGEKAVTACRNHRLLAVCHAGGASTKEFGGELDILFGKDVILWPDNDPSGREFMRRLKEALLPIAKSIRVICPPSARERRRVGLFFCWWQS